MSPGRALMDVQAKLNQYKNGGGLAERQPKGRPEEDDEEPPARAAQLPAAAPVRPEAFDDATAEIADIDTRLHALQTFLRAAKAGSGATIGAVTGGG